MGLLAADWEVLWLRLELDRGLVRSRPPTLAVMGEWRESFRVWTGEEVRDGMDRGGGDENLRQRRGDLSFMCSPPLLFWLVAKNSSKDLERAKKPFVSKIIGYLKKMERKRGIAAAQNKSLFVCVP